MLKLLFLPIIGAFIGWITNILAIKLLFRPLKPIRVLFWTYQGLLPRYRDELAVKIGQILEEQILVADEMEKHWQSMGLEVEVERILEDYIREKVKHLLKFTPSSLQNMVIGGFKNLVRGDIKEKILEVRETLTDKLLGDSKIGDLVVEKIKSLDMKQVEALVLQVISRELRHVELLGGVLGFVIGILQVLVIIFL